MRHLFAALLLLQATAPQTPARQPMPVLPLQRWIDDMHTKNLADILTMYTPNTRFIDPDHHSFFSPDARRKLFESVFATYDSDLDIDVFSSTAGTKPNPIAAVQSGYYHENLRLRASGQITVACGIVGFVWEKQHDGRWLISFQTWVIGRCRTEQH